MIDKSLVVELVNKFIEDTDLFLVDVSVSASNHIRVFVDSERGVSIRECADLTRALEEGMNRDEEDFNLEVSSPGLSEPLKVLQQYKKNIGRDIEVITIEGTKHKGELIGLTKEGFTIVEEVKVKGEKKRPVIKSVERDFNFDKISSARVLVSYK